MSGGMAKPDPEFTLSPSLVDTLRERIRELEAEIEKAVSFGQACVAGGSDWMKRAEQAEAELANEKRCADDNGAVVLDLHARVIAMKYELAALKAENAGLRSHQACTKRAEQAEAEVVRLSDICDRACEAGHS